MYLHVIFGFEQSETGSQRYAVGVLKQKMTKTSTRMRHASELL